MNQVLIHNFISVPFPLWEIDVTEIIVQRKWLELDGRKIIPLNYSLCGLLAEAEQVPPNPQRVPIQSSSFIGPQVEYFCTSKAVSAFFKNHGLNPSSSLEITRNLALEKLRCALLQLYRVDLLKLFIGSVVKSIHVLNQDDPDIDVSFSHPVLPFSIFLTVCQENDAVSQLRVAESILHEAMHLKLSLLEEYVPMIIHGSTELYFSPWRSELRPAAGILHGIFVFRAVYDFYCKLQMLSISRQEAEYILSRKCQIEAEFCEVEGFSRCSGLTEAGANLTKGLLPLN